MHSTAKVVKVEILIMLTPERTEVVVVEVHASGVFIANFL
jgi:hypothetical protein